MQDLDKITIPPHTKKELFFNGQYLFNAYMAYYFSGGKGAKVRFICFERFFHADKNIKRDDAVQGTPFWYRTLRFLKIVVETREEEAVMYRPVVRKTGYPL